MYLSHRVLVIDVETTGFDPAKNACIEIGAVMLDQSLQIIQEYSSLVAPWKGADMVEAAMNINGISRAELESAPDAVTVVNQLYDALEFEESLPLVAGWNVWFDAAFLREVFRRGKRPWPFSYRLLDLQSIYSFHRLLDSSSQEKTIEAFLYERQAHRALSDARHTARLLQFIAARYLPRPLTTSNPAEDIC